MIEAFKRIPDAVSDLKNGRDLSSAVRRVFSGNSREQIKAQRVIFSKATTYNNLLEILKEQGGERVLKELIVVSILRKLDLICGKRL